METVPRGRCTSGRFDGGGLRQCAQPRCSTIVFGSGFCVECERLAANLATAEIEARACARGRIS